MKTNSVIAVVSSFLGISLFLFVAELLMYFGVIYAKEQVEAVMLVSVILSIACVIYFGVYFAQTVRKLTWLNRSDVVEKRLELAKESPEKLKDLSKTNFSTGRFEIHEIIDPETPGEKFEIVDHLYDDRTEYVKFDSPDIS